MIPENFEHDGVAVRQTLTIFKRWQTIFPHNRVDLGLCLPGNLGLLDHCQKERLDGRNGLHSVSRYLIWECMETDRA